MLINFLLRWHSVSSLQLDLRLVVRVQFDYFLASLLFELFVRRHLACIFELRIQFWLEKLRFCLFLLWGFIVISAAAKLQ